MSKTTTPTRRTRTIETASCPACSCERGYQGPTFQTVTCQACGCLHGTTYLGDSYGLVKDCLTSDRTADARQLPFDLTCLGSAGITRRHGFYDPTTRLMTQVG